MIYTTDRGSTAREISRHDFGGETWIVAEVVNRHGEAFVSTFGVGEQGLTPADDSAWTAALHVHVSRGNQTDRGR